MSFTNNHDDGHASPLFVRPGLESSAFVYQLAIYLQMTLAPRCGAILTMRQASTDD